MCQKEQIKLTLYNYLSVFCNDSYTVLLFKSMFWNISFIMIHTQFMSRLSSMDLINVCYVIFLYLHDVKLLFSADKCGSDPSYSSFIQYCCDFVPACSLYWPLINNQCSCNVLTWLFSVFMLLCDPPTQTFLTYSVWGLCL